MPRPRKDLERNWYDVFARWPREDRAAALKVLTILHEQLPDEPKHKVPAGGTEQPAPRRIPA